MAHTGLCFGRTGEWEVVKEQIRVYFDMKCLIMRLCNGIATKEETSHKMAVLKDEGKPLHELDSEFGKWQEAITLQQRELTKTRNAPPSGEEITVKAEVHTEQGPSTQALPIKGPGPVATSSPGNRLIKAGASKTEDQPVSSPGRSG